MNNLEQCLKNTLFNKHSHTKLNFFQMAHSTKDRMLAHLSALQSLRGTGTQDAVFSQHLLIVKRWQSAAWRALTQIWQHSRAMRLPWIIFSMICMPPRISPNGMRR
jgi:hypothetical protein